MAVPTGVAAFVAKLTDSSSEAAETQTWIEFAVQCNYLDLENGRELYKIYNSILGMLVSMIHNSHQWIIPPNNNKYQLSDILHHSQQDLTNRVSKRKNKLF